MLYGKNAKLKEVQASVHVIATPRLGSLKPHIPASRVTRTLVTPPRKSEDYALPIQSLLIASIP